ncbi:glycosyl transferase [Leptospira perolatii]|uniref:Glycosyl transferase n=1 Tax=Leptospira perolatii TaxID=2023191 RepID=A0A2M9ZJ33_9LEPT|nr:glycosyltransferase family 2 protein [Leptospira perolatii]PJZ69517.1 glycosyl transferase [Leptospira perolatii]PJZ72032.1 glycosyl transferase [Leptospira perolatii]
MKDKKIAVILPAYNEESTLEDTIAAFGKELPKAEFLIIDNNSSDHTKRIGLESIQKHSVQGRVITEYRQGKANAVRRAFAELDADLYILSDADTTYPASEVHNLIEMLEKESLDMVVGDRLSQGIYGKENKRLLHSTGNNLVKKLINFLFDVKLRDVLSGYRVFSRKFVKNYPVLSSGFELEIEMTLHALDKRFLIREIPISYKDRPAGSFSKLRTLRDGYRVLNTIFWIFKDYKPMHFFGFLSGLAFVASILSGIPSILDYIQYRYVYHVPLAVLAVGLMVVSILCFSIGLILHTVAKIQRFNFELQLLKEKF